MVKVNAVIWSCYIPMGPEWSLHTRFSHKRACSCRAAQRVVVEGLCWAVGVVCLFVGGCTALAARPGPPIGPPPAHCCVVVVCSVVLCSAGQCCAVLDIVMHRPWSPIGRGCADCCVVVVRRAAVARWALVELVYLSLVHFPLAASS